MKHPNSSSLAATASIDRTLSTPFSPAPSPPPSNSASGIQEITWTGFANQTFTLKPAVNSTLTLPPIKLDIVGKRVFYSDAIQVEAKYIPKPLSIPLDLVGKWFVQRQIMEGFDLSKQPKPPTVIETTNLTINNQGLAVSKPGSLAIDLGAKEARWIQYRLGRRVTIVVPGGPGKPIKTKQVLEFLDESVAVFPIPNLGQPAYTVNTYRPVPCEFKTVKFEILGKNGQVLQTVKTDELPPINVPISEAKTQVGPPDNLQLTYAARWTVKRINPPNLSPTQGYIVQSGKVENVFINELSPVVNGLNLSGDVGQEFVLNFDITRAVNSGVTTRELCLGNAVTNSYFIGQLFASAQAETNLRLNW